MTDISDADKRSMTVLVVDDFESMRLIVANHLHAFGFPKVLMASNGQEAFKSLKDNTIHLVLSDWNMPVMTGIDLLKTVRADPELRHLPFIMITAEAKREQITEAAYSGVSDLIIKPYTTARLYERISKALQPGKRAEIPKRTGPSAKPAPGAAESGARERSRPSILVVDDTPDNLHLIAGLFKEEYQVRIANSGEKALEIIRSDNKPDLVLLDIMMPGIDGFTVFDRMRKDPDSEHIPVIFVTAMTGDDAFLKGLELGAIDFVTKPINPEILKLRVKNLMRYVELYRQLQDESDLMIEKAKLQEDVEHIVRHDVKGPLAGVIAIVQSLAADATMDKRHVEQLRTVEETAFQALNIINLSSELFKIETGSFQLNPQPVMIEHTLRRIAEISQAAFAAKKIRIEIEADGKTGDKPMQAQGDPMLCYSLFHNLVKNACEAAPEGTMIRIGVIEEDPLLKISIQNAGTVPAEIRERFFDKYVTRGKQGGTGVGTYSARMLAEAQNGKIEMTTSDSKNETDITVTLPRLSGTKPEQ